MKILTIHILSLQGVMIKLTLIILYFQKNEQINNFSVKLSNQESVQIFNQDPHLFLTKLLSYSNELNVLGIF